MDMSVIALTSIVAILTFVVGFAIAKSKAQGGLSDVQAELKQINAHKQQLENDLDSKENEVKELFKEIHALQIKQERNKAEYNHNLSHIETLESNLANALGEIRALQNSEKKCSGNCSGSPKVRTKFNRATSEGQPRSAAKAQRKG